MSDLVQWVGKDGGYKVGKKVILDGSVVYRGKLADDGLTYIISYLVQHSHTLELEFVRENKLSVYQDRKARTIPVDTNGMCKCYYGECQIGVHITGSAKCSAEEIRAAGYEVGEPTSAYVNQDR